MHEVLVNHLGGLSLPRKSVVRLSDRPDMTLDVYRGRKTTKQQQQQYYLVKNGFHSLSSEKISLLDSYFIHRYLIIKYRSSLNLCIIHLLLWELWPLFGFIHTALSAL